MGSGPHFPVSCCQWRCLGAGKKCYCLVVVDGGFGSFLH